MHTCILSCTLSIYRFTCWEVNQSVVCLKVCLHIFTLCFQRIIRRNEWFSVIEKVKPLHAIKCAWHTNVYLNESLSIQSFTIVKNLLRSMSIIIHNVHRSKSWIILKVNLSCNTCIGFSEQPLGWHSFIEHVQNHWKTVQKRWILFQTLPSTWPIHMGHKGQSKGFYQYIKSIWKTHKLNKNEFHLNIHVNDFSCQ